MASPTRVAYLDNLKVVLVAGVIFGHGWAGYDQLGSWAYSDVREVSIAPVTETVLEVLLGPFGLFAMGFFLLVSGMTTPDSLSRKGSVRYLRDRLVRLGVPLVVFTYVAWPPVAYLLARVARRPYRFSFTHPDPVHLWFVEVLLLFSVAYALWPRLPSGPDELRTGHLLWLAAAVAVATFLVRQRFPLDSTQVADLHLWQWPQYLAMFGLGLLGARRGWLDPVPERLMRACRIAAAFGALGIAVCAAVVALRHVPPAEFFGGWHWAAVLPAAAEGLLAVTVSVWLLGLAQRHLDRPWRAGRGAYAAFLVQGHVLVGLALLLRPVAVPAEVKGLVVSVLGVVLCFGIGRLSVGVRRSLTSDVFDE